MSDAIAIIGAGPGIGRATALRFGRAGWRVALIGRGEARLAALAAELTEAGIAAFAVPADATQPEGLRAALATADRLTDGLTAVHFNAAVVRQQDLFSMSDAAVVDDLAIDIAAGLHSIRAAVAQFRQRGGGTVLVTGGGLAIAPHADWAVLGLGKAALRNLVQALAVPLAAEGIRIATVSVATLVAPGSAQAVGVADSLWQLATAADAPWELSFPAAA